MRIPRNSKIELLTDKKSYEDIFYSDGVLRATEGHCFVSIPVTDYEDDKTGVIPRKVLETARKATGKGEDIQLVVNDASSVTVPALGNATFQTVTTNPPNFKAATPDPEPYTFQVSLNAELLAKIAKGLDSAIIELSFNPENDEGLICIRPTGDKVGEAVLMPCETRG